MPGIVLNSLVMFLTFAKTLSFRKHLQMRLRLNGTGETKICIQVYKCPNQSPFCGTTLYN